MSVKNERIVKVHGREYTIRQLATLTGVKPDTIRKRDNKGLKDEALFTDQRATKDRPMTMKAPMSRVERKAAEQAKRERLRAEINQLVGA